jgi:branched-chain amino acid transport system permease protein
MLAQQIINGLMLGSVYVLVAVAFTITIGVLNFLNFSLPAIFMLCGMACWALRAAGVSWTATALLVFLIGALVSLVIERFTWRRQRSAGHFVPLVSAMAFLILIENLVLLRWGSDIETVPPPFAAASFRLDGLLLSPPELIGLGAAILLVLALVLVLRHTRLGRGLRAIAENADTASLLGVSVNRVVPAVFLISGLFTAFAALLFVLNYHQARFDMGQAVALKGIAAMVLGGMGSVWGAVAGGLLLGIVEVFSVWRFGADFANIAVYGLLVLILTLRPTGLFIGAGARASRF